MFHKFTTDKILQKKWLIAIKSQKKTTKHTKICSKHFSEDSYTVTSMGKLNNKKISVILFYLIF